MPEKKSLEEISEQDNRYNPKAVRFVYEGLGYTIRKSAGQPGHITGQTLCEGLRLLALDKWGLLAMLVLDSWHVKTTRDFGEIVYLLTITTRKPTPQTPKISAIWIIGRSRYWLYPISAQGKPVKRWLREYSRITHAAGSKNNRIPENGIDRTTRPNTPKYSAR